MQVVPHLFFVVVLTKKLLLPTAAHLSQRVFARGKRGVEQLWAFRDSACHGVGGLAPRPQDAILVTGGGRDYVMLGVLEHVYFSLIVVAHLLWLLLWYAHFYPASTQA